MSSNIKGIMVEIGGDTSKLQSALKKTNTSANHLSKELKGINSLLKLDPKSTELVAQKQTVLKEAIKETNEKLEVLKETQKQALENIDKVSPESYRNLEREIVLTQSKLRELQTQASKWTKSGKAVEEFGQKISNTSVKVTNLGNNLSKTITPTIIGIATTAIASMDKVDEGLDTIAVKTGATGDSAKELQEIFREVAGDMPAEFGDIGAAIGEINTRLDLTGDNLKNASRDFLKFAKVNGIDVNTSVQLVTRAMGDAGIKVEDYAKLLDMLTVAGQKSGISIDSLATNLAKYGAPMRALGIDTENAIAMFAGWEKAGVNTEIAFSGMKKAISNWGAAGKDSTKEFSKTLEEIKKCPTIAKATTKAIEVFGAKAGPDLADAIQGGRFEFEKYVEALKSGSGTVENTYGQIIDEVDDTQLAFQNIQLAMHDTGEVIAKSVGPVVLDLAKDFKTLMDKFDKLDPKLKQNILKYGAMAAAGGPVISMLGKLGNITGKTTKGIGNFIQAIGVSTGKINSSNDSVKKLAKGMSMLTNPIGLTVAGITVLITSLIGMERQISKNVEKAKEIKQEVESQTQARKELRAEQEKQLSSNLAEITNTQGLYNELKTITDENGKIKEGYEERANFIVTQLSQALGTEISINKGIIKSYKEIQQQIDKTIAKKEAEIYLQTQEESYSQAIQKRGTAYEGLIDIQNKLNEAQKKVLDLQQEVEKSGGIGKVLAAEKLRAAKAEVLELNTAIGEQKGLIAGYTDDVNTYKENSKLMAEGTIESYNKIIENVTNKMTEHKVKLEGTLDEQIILLQSNIDQQKELLNIALSNQDETNAKAYQNQIEADEKQLTELGIKLAKMTSKVEELTPEQIEAWKSLAENSKTSFNEAIKYVPSDVQSKLIEILNITETSTIPDNFGTLASVSKNSFNNNLGTINNDTSNLLETVSQKIKNDTNVKDGMEKLAKEAEKGFNNNVNPGKWGFDLTKELSTNMTSEKSRKLISNASTTVAGWISSFLHFSIPDEGPLSDMDKSMPDMIELMTNGIDDNKLKLLHSIEKMSKEMNETINNQINNLRLFDFDKLNNKLDNKIINNSKTIFTTPNLTIYTQEFDAKKIANEVNKVFGSHY